MRDHISYPIFKDQSVICATSTRIPNLGFIDDAAVEKVIKSRKDFLKKFHINIKNLVCLKQIHSSKVYKATKNDAGRGALVPTSRIYGFDSIITDATDLAIAVFTADCFPIFLFDKENRAVGIIHAGWRGTKLEIVKKTINEMKKFYETKPENLKVAIGPAIRKCCYKVKKDVADSFRDCVIKKGKALYLDLACKNLKQLLESGVKKGNIYDCNICASCQNKLFFSYRKEGEQAGRMMSFIMLKQE